MTLDLQSPTETEFTSLTIAEAADHIAARRLSPVDLTEAFLSRIEALDPQVNAFIRVLPEEARAEAKTAEAAVMNGTAGPLAGIPYGVKDIFCTAGVPTTGHSRPYADFVPTEDATSVAGMRRAGAVLMGKLSTHENAHGGPSFDLAWPPARNPWNLEHFTGGSSSGSGAGVAAGMMMGALGSDTGGSIRNPAALCGLVGLKPTYGLVSRHGVMANSFSYDHAGPLTWTVEDCALMLQAIAGPDEKDPASARAEVPDYRAALTGDIRGLRIGVIRHLYEEDLTVAQPLQDALEKAYEVLRSLGAELEEVRIRPAQDYYDVKIVTAETELYAVHERMLKSRLSEFGEDFLARSLAASMIRGADYVQAQRERRIMQTEMAEIYARYDVLITAGPGPAPRLDAWRAIDFWRKPNITTPFNVTGGPALVQCIGFTPDGLPMAMQIVGAPLDDATVLRVAHAYERATDWRSVRPVLDPQASPLPLPPLPEPEPSDMTPAQRDTVAMLCERAGLVLNDRHFEQLCATLPHLDAMLGRIRRDRDFYEEPANVFRFP